MTPPLGGARELSMEQPRRYDLDDITEVALSNHEDEERLVNNKFVTQE